MSLIKEARRQVKGGDCTYFDKTNSICNHKEMNREYVTAESITPYGEQYYEASDDYANAE